jgi:hypothetical protein
MNWLPNKKITIKKADAVSVSAFCFLTLQPLELLILYNLPMIRFWQMGQHLLIK